MSARLFLGLLSATRMLALLLVVAAAPALAQGHVPAWGTGGSSLGSTTSAMDVYAEPGGNDSHDCLTVGTACATVQGELARVPKLLAHPVRVHIGAGLTCTGAWVEGFRRDRSNTYATGSWLQFVGDSIAFVPATGTAAGTATAGTKGTWSDETVNTMTDSGQTWTSNDLKGKLLHFTGGHNIGSSYTIISNTSTVISFGNNPAQTTAAGDTYTILDWGTTCDGNLNYPVTPSGYYTNFTGVYTFVVIANASDPELVSFNNIKFTSTTAISAIAVFGPASVSVQYSFFNGGGSTKGYYAINLEMGSKVTVLDSVFSFKSGWIGITTQDDPGEIYSGQSGVSYIVTKGNFAFGATPAGNLGRFIIAAASSWASNYDYALDIDRFSTYSGGTVAIVGHDILKNVNIGYSSTQGTNSQNGYGSMLTADNCYYDTIKTEVFNIAAGALRADHIAGTGIANGIRCVIGCYAQVTASTSFGTVSGNDIVEETTSESLTTMRVTGVLLDAKYGSRVSQ